MAGGSRHISESQRRDHSVGAIEQHGRTSPGAGRYGNRVRGRALALGADRRAGRSGSLLRCLRITR